MTPRTAPRDRTLATAVDVHGLLVTLEHDLDPTTGRDDGLHLTMNGTTAAFDPTDETQRAGLVALHDALSVLLAVPNEVPPTPWTLSRLDREDDVNPKIVLPDHLAVTDNVMTLDGERSRIVWVSTYSRTVYVRPEPIGDHR